VNFLLTSPMDVVFSYRTGSKYSEG